MNSQVYFADLRTDFTRNITSKIHLLLEKTGINKSISKSDTVALKLHFGEKGNTAFIRPVFIRDIVDKIIQCGASPFLTDANTLYRGERSDAVSHINIALAHGFTTTTAGAPLVIADGLTGTDDVKVKINGKHFSSVSIASAIFHSDVILSIAHFKGHELTGFGGTLKNLGMGCASRQGKLNQHSNISPKIRAKLCSCCGKCIKTCPVDAIEIIGVKAKINSTRCIGCAQCITTCPDGAVKIKWNGSSETFQEKMVEYVLGVLKDRQHSSIFLNFLMNISPACDCYTHSDTSIVPDIGILASTDPVAIDQASVDLLNQQEGFKNSALKTNHNKGEDKIKGLYPEIEWGVQLNYAEKLGIGRRKYTLVKI